MASSRFRFVLHPFLGVLVCLALVQVFGGKRKSGPAMHEEFLNPPPEYIEHFHFGFKDSLADSLWLRWIQDNDSCQTYLSKALYSLEPKPTETPKESLFWVPRHKICEQSWSFKMLDAITKLAPRFDIPYLMGASTLAILVEDFSGASEIYERGLREYPEDWQLLYRASFHYQFNLKDIPKAANLLLRAADHGAPVWTRSLAARLYTAGGQFELGLRILESYRKTTDPENKEALKQIDKRIADLRAKLQGIQVQ